ncbi:MAG TPA: hypothetical protein VFV34_13675, partial [Blastocatellia bacterium]|nr:hypothetical protein [Blastocatellia bacterium]
VGAGGCIAQLQGRGEIYVLRGGRTTDFWVLRRGVWTSLAPAPGPVDSGGSLVGLNHGSSVRGNRLYALQGGGSTAVWKYDVQADKWSHLSDALGPIGPGGCITAPNTGGDDEGYLDIVQGGGSSTVWSLAVAANAWKVIDTIPGPVLQGGATSQQFNGCDFTFAGGDSNQFVATGHHDCQTVPEGFSLHFDNSTVTAARGTKATITLRIVRDFGFTNAVTVFAPDPPIPGLRVPEGPLTPEDDAVSFKIKVKAGASPGPHEMVFTGVDSSGIRRTVTLTLFVV